LAKESVVSDNSIARRLAAQTAQYLTIHEKLGVRLLDTLESDKNEAGSPSRDWCRGYQRYQNGIKDLLSEQREALRLRHELKLEGKQLTDEEYRSELLDLGKETLRSLTRDELSKLLADAGVQLEVVDVEAEDREA
jgi:hypothetical protein